MITSISSLQCAKSSREGDEPTAVSAERRTKAQTNDKPRRREQCINHHRGAEIGPVRRGRLQRLEPKPQRRTSHRRSWNPSKTSEGTNKTDQKKTILQEESQQQRRDPKKRGGDDGETRRIKNKSGNRELKANNTRGILQAVWFQVNK